MPSDSLDLATGGWLPWDWVAISWPWLLGQERGWAAHELRPSTGGCKVHGDSGLCCDLQVPVRGTVLFPQPRQLVLAAASHRGTAKCHLQAFLSLFCPVHVWLLWLNESDGRKQWEKREPPFLMCVPTAYRWPASWAGEGPGIWVSYYLGNFGLCAKLSVPQFPRYKMGLIIVSVSLEWCENKMR